MGYRDQYIIETAKYRERYIAAAAKYPPLFLYLQNEARRILPRDAANAIRGIALEIYCKRRIKGRRAYVVCPGTADFFKMRASDKPWDLLAIGRIKQSTIDENNELFNKARVKLRGLHG